MAGTKYTTIAGLQKIESDRHLINLAVDTSNSLITEWEVWQNLEAAIEDASREFDGFVRGHATVPFTITETALTGVVTFTKGSTAVSAVGGAFDTELAAGDYIHLDVDTDVRAVVSSITDANNLILTAEYYGDAAAAGSASIITDDVPDEVENIVRGYTAYLLWARRGRDHDKNPHKSRMQLFMQRVKDIQRGNYRFVKDDDTIEEKPVRYNTESERTMTDDSLSGYCP